MNWCDERYVRLYTRDTADWLALSFEAQALLALLLRKVDRSGVLELGKHGKRAAAIAVGHASRWDVLEPALDELLADGCVVLDGNRLVILNFIEAQEAIQSDRLRQAESRARRRELSAKGQPTDRHGFVYVVRAGAGELKIGFASDVASRLRNIRTARPDGVELVASWPGTDADEASALAAFADLRISGEWFRDDGRIVAWATTQSRPVTEAQRPVTESHARSQAVTRGHAASRDVTPSVPSVPSVPSEDPRPAGRVLDLPIDTSPRQRFDFEAVYAAYPRKEGRKKGLERLAKLIRTPADFEACLAAAKLYAAHCAQTGQYLKHFDTWVGEWEDWAPGADGRPKNGAAAAPAGAEVPRWAR